MASTYPTSLDNLATTKTNATTTSTDHPAHHNDLADAVNKIEAELGTTPSGSAATVAARFDTVESALMTYKNIAEAGARTGAVNAVAVYTPVRALTSEAAGTANSGAAAFYLDPADYAVTGRVTKLRLRGSLLTNATAPAVDITYGLYPITSVAGASGNVQLTLDTVVTGSTIAFTTPAANSMFQGNSGDFTAPTAGYYVLGFVASNTAAAGSALGVDLRLQVRQIPA